MYGNYHCFRSKLSIQFKSKTVSSMYHKEFISKRNSENQQKLRHTKLASLIVTVKSQVYSKYYLDKLNLSEKFLSISAKSY
jgi:hypothetical protein